MIKYPKIKPLGDSENSAIFSNDEHYVYITEKIDGGNFRFALESGELIFGSRNRELIEDALEQKQWKKSSKFISDNAPSKLPEEFEDYTFFGECCTPHTLKYNWEEIPPFLGFDVYSEASEGFVNGVMAVSLFKELNLPFVPTIGKFKVSEVGVIDESHVPVSLYRKGIDDEMAEGIVIKNYINQTFAKIVRSRFKEENKLKFGGSPRFGKNDTEKIYLSYCTTARIEKQIYRLRDEEEMEVSRPMMHKLPSAVLYDIYEEHWRDICLKKNKVDFGLMKKLVSRRCLSVLDGVIQKQIYDMISEGDNE